MNNKNIKIKKNEIEVKRKKKIVREINEEKF